MPPNARLRSQRKIVHADEELLELKDDFSKAASNVQPLKLERADVSAEIASNKPHGHIIIVTKNRFG